MRSFLDREREKERAIDMNLHFGRVSFFIILKTFGTIDIRRNERAIALRIFGLDL
jgi:hypothetical protein